MPLLADKLKMKLHIVAVSQFYAEIKRFGNWETFFFQSTLFFSEAHDPFASAYKYNLSDLTNDWTEKYE